MAFWYWDGRVNHAKMPETQESILSHIQSFATYARGHGSDPIAVIEKPPMFCGKDTPSSRIAVLFDNFGFIKGVLMALQIPTDEVGPKEWQASYAERPRTMKYSQWKSLLCSIAKEKFPNEKVTLKTSDAMLMLHWKLRLRGIKNPGGVPVGGVQPELAEFY